MGEGRHRDLDLAAVLQFAVDGDHLVHQPQMLVEHDLLIFLGKALSLLGQSGQRRFGQPCGVGPGQVEQHLQVAEVVGREVAQGIDATIAQLQ